MNTVSTHQDPLVRCEGAHRFIINVKLKANEWYFGFSKTLKDLWHDINVDGSITG